MLGSASRFWSKVDQSGDCWEWTASLNNSGYGQFFPVRLTMVTAHRYSWTLEHGEIPEGMYVLHSCDNRRCVRPSHLYLGDAKQNAADSIARGRHANASKTACSNGHPFDEKNTRVSGGRRVCRACQREAARERIG